MAVKLVDVQTNGCQTVMLHFPLWTWPA